jgi:hypothetical protein
MSTTTTPINVSSQRATLAALLAALVNGINTELAGVDPFVFDGTTYPRADLLARIQAVLDAIARVKAARTALQQAVASQRAALAEGRALRAGMKRNLQAKYGPTSPKLQLFGFTPARTPKPTAATKAQAQVKAKSTRVARGTKGKKAKLAIHGAPAPVAPATPPAAPAPAPAGGNGPSKA